MTEKKENWKSNFQGINLSPDFPAEQWDTLAGCKLNDKAPATLREVVDETIPTLDFDDMSEEKQRELVIKRLEQKPDFTMNLISVGAIDKERAIREVKEQTLIGKTIMEVQKHAINYLRTKADLQKSRE